MSKQKLAQMVKQKMKQKKQQQERNIPHYEVLRLEVRFKIEQNQILKNKISYITQLLQKEQQQLSKLKKNLQELDSTGKKNYPSFIIKPQFIASENISPNIKEFYRKAANTFIKGYLLRKINFKESLEKEQILLKDMKSIKQKQENIRITNQEERQITNKKRTKVLKQDLKLRAIKQLQQSIKETINLDKQQNKNLINQYELKKTNLQSRIDYSVQLEKYIQNKKNEIQMTYNPITYRQYLKKVFLIRIKNQLLEKNLTKIITKVEQGSKKTQDYQLLLQRKNILLKIGLTANSPSKQTGWRKVQKSKEKNNKNTETMPMFPQNRSKSQSQRKIFQSNEKLVKNGKISKTQDLFQSAKQLQKTNRSQISLSTMAKTNHSKPMFE